MILKIIMLGKVIPLLTPTPTLIAYTLKAYNDTVIPSEILKRELGISGVNISDSLGSNDDISVAYLNDILLQVVSDLGITELSDLYRYLGIVEVYFKGDIGRYRDAYYKYFDKCVEFVLKSEDAKCVSSTSATNHNVSADRVETRFGYITEVQQSEFQI